MTDTSSIEYWQSSIQDAIRRNDLRLLIGCGKRLLDGWINIDGNQHAGVLQLTMPEGLSHFTDNSVRYIYTSHFLEHIAYPGEATTLVQECLRILVPGGRLRIVVPGIEKIIHAYQRNDKAFFDIQATLHPAWCTTPLEHLMYALQQDGEHKYGYDFVTLHKLLSQAGFENITNSDCNTSLIENLRIDYRALRENHGRTLSLYAEAIKPGKTNHD